VVSAKQYSYAPVTSKFMYDINVWHGEKPRTKNVAMKLL